MKTYVFPKSTTLRRQLIQVLPDQDLREKIIDALTAVGSVEVGKVFDILYRMRNSVPPLVAWVDERMPNIIEAITPNDEDFRTRLLRSWDDAING